MNSVLYFNNPNNYIVNSGAYINTMPIFHQNDMSDSQNFAIFTHKISPVSPETTLLPAIDQTSMAINNNFNFLPPVNLLSQELNTAPSPTQYYEAPQTTFYWKSSQNLSLSDYCLWEDIEEKFCNSNSNEIMTSAIKKTRCIPKTENDSVILKGYQFRFRYETSNGRKKKIIVWKYDNCHKEFTKTWSFLYHARMHEGEKPFKCQVCDRSFSQKSNLTKHMKHHVLTTVSERKLFRCNICPKGYTERYNLRKHLKIKHGIITDRSLKMMPKFSEQIKPQ